MTLFQSSRCSMKTQTPMKVVTRFDGMIKAAATGATLAVATISMCLLAIWFLLETRLY